MAKINENYLATLLITGRQNKRNMHSESWMIHPKYGEVEKQENLHSW